MALGKLLPLNRIAWLGVVIAAGVSFLAIAGWALNWIIIAQINPKYTPMSPSTASMILLLCTSWFVGYCKPSSTRRRMIAEACALAVLAFVLLMLIEFLAGIPFNIEQVFVIVGDRLGSAPVGRMSPVTAAALVLAAFSLVIMFSAGGYRTKQTAAVLVVDTASIGFVVFLGYLFGSPLWNESSIIPVALPTAIALDFLGIGLCASVGRTVWPVRTLVGPSVNARLLRVFIPFMVAVVICASWFFNVGVSRTGNPALTASIGLFIALTGVIVVLSRVSGSIGGEIDRSHEELRKSEQMLRSSEAKFRQIYEDSNDALMLADEKGFFDCNTRTLEVFGCKNKEEFTRLHPADVSPPFQPDGKNSLTAAQEQIQTAFRKGHIRFEWTHRRRNGEDFQAEVLLSAFALDGKNVLQATVDDITERKQLEDMVKESEARHRAVFENSVDAILIATTDGSILAANPAAERMFGRTREELCAVGRKGVVDTTDPRLRTLLEERTRTGKFTGELTLKRKDETKFPAELTTSIFRDRNGVERSSMIIRDITERKQTELALRERMKELNCLFNVSRSIEQGGSNLDMIMGEVVSSIPPAYPYPEGTCARIVLGKRTFKSAGFKESSWRQSADIRVFQNNVGTVEVYCLEERPVSFEGPFLKEERILLDSIAQRLGRVIERKEAQDALHESEARYRDLFENSTDLIQAVNSDGRFEYVNTKWLDSLGYSREEVERLSLMDILRKDQVSHCMELFSRIRNGESMDRVETVFVSKDRREILVEGNVNAQFKDGKFVASRAIFRDVTERKKIDRMKDQFVSMVSHELRTPLTSIRASLGLLASGLSGTLPEKGQRMLEIAITNTDRLVRLINDILDSERLVSGKTPMEKKQCSSAQLVEQAVNVMKPMAEKASVSLSVESQDAELYVDMDRMIQVLTNLISNAIKFSTKDGHIWVTAKRENNQVLFRIQDEGRGIPPEKIGSLFERFQQVDSSDAREKGGSGLGLAISRSIIEQHNGKIWIESSVGKGSTFHFTIPLQREDQTPTQPESNTATETTSKAVIIEDDPDLAKILAETLQRHNIQCIIAPTGRSGIELIRQIRPDMIVLDLGLPDMDGSTVVQNLREDNTLRMVPLVVYAVRELNKEQQENLRLGETLFFIKSRMPPDQFEEKVVQFMKHIRENKGETNAN